MKVLENKILLSLTSLNSFENSEIQSVVCLIYLSDKIFFIQRSEKMPTHKGDIAFVGGHKQSGESILDCAMREFEEELGLEADILSFKGYLAPVSTSHFKKVAVCVFKLNLGEEEFLATIKSNGEWDESFFIECSVLNNKRNWTFAKMVKGDLEKEIYFCNLNRSNKNIWGMTGSVLMSIFNHY